jgi:hypothetical protein
LHLPVLFLPGWATFSVEGACLVICSFMNMTKTGISCIFHLLSSSVKNITCSWILSWARLHFQGCIGLLSGKRKEELWAFCLNSYTGLHIAKLWFLVWTDTCMYYVDVWMMSFSQF